MWYARFMRCKRDIERLAAMSELKLDDANPVRTGRGETRVRRGAQGLLTRSGKAVRRSITKRTSPMTGAGGFAAYKRERAKSVKAQCLAMSKMPSAASVRVARNTAFSDEAICAGLDGAANLKIAAPSGGRANRPYQNVRTVARTEDVTLTRHGLSINRKIQRRYHCTTVAHSSNPLHFRVVIPLTERAKLC